MGFFLNFGEQIEGYNYKVVNERDARASAGIMFLLGLISFFSVPLLRDIFWAELFTITFIIEFMVRVLINPKYAPYMLIGGLIVSNQQPDWVEAKPKRFAWALGMLLGLIMSYYIFAEAVSMIRMLICILCLFLMYVESVFGICLGCILYKKMNWKLYNCPGGICEVGPKNPYDKRKLIIILGFITLFVFTYVSLKTYRYPDPPKTVIVDE